MPTSLRIQDLSSTEIADLLAKEGHKVPPSLVPELTLFMDEIYRMQSGNPAGEPAGELDAAA